MLIKGSRSRFTLHRRTMLRGLAGGSAVALALPLLDAMLDNHGEALAGGAPLPRRMITWFWGNGVALNDPGNGGSGLRWTPATQGAGFELTPQLAPFANVRDYLSICSGFRVGAANPGRRGHHDGCVLFAGHPFVELPPNGANYASKFGGPTIDQVAAAAVGSQTFLPSVQLAVSKRIIGGEGPTLEFLSHKGPDEPLQQIFDPREAYNQMFGSFTVPDDPTKPHRLASLDAVKADVERLKMRVGTADRMRLDAHLSSIDQIRSQIDALAPACAIPPMTDQSNDDLEGQEQLEAVNLAMTELVSMAFACDLTRVVSIQFTGSVGYTVFNAVGADRGHHDMTHDAAMNDMIDACTVWTMQQLAVLLEGLFNTEEGAGNVLDNTVLLASSDASSGLTHSTDDMPIVIAGGGGGALTHPGIHYRSQSGENTSDILLAILKSMVPDATEVGSGNGLSNTPLSALLA
ncbi:MAG: DUF1552 domain-containing protein [Deltaproteobacteria bacterium]|nr:DUF1552 domain-containing protein [Nannocystaceae bacterium]